jgi:hypothetical protein
MHLNVRKKISLNRRLTILDYRTGYSCVCVYEKKFSMYRRMSSPDYRTGYMHVSVYEENGAYMDASLYMSTEQGRCV